MPKKTGRPEAAAALTARGALIFIFHHFKKQHIVDIYIYVYKYIKETLLLKVHLYSTHDTHTCNITGLDFILTIFK